MSYLREKQKKTSFFSHYVYKTFHRPRKHLKSGGRGGTSPKTPELLSNCFKTREYILSHKTYIKKRFILILPNTNSSQYKYNNLHEYDHTVKRTTLNQSQISLHVTDNSACQGKEALFHILKKVGGVGGGTFPQWTSSPGAPGSTALETCYQAYLKKIILFYIGNDT